MRDFYHHLSIWLVNYNYLYLQTLCLHCRRAKVMNMSSFCGDNTYNWHFTTLKYTTHLLTTVTILYNSSLKWILPIWTVYPLSKIFHFHFLPPPICCNCHFILNLHNFGCIRPPHTNENMQYLLFSLLFTSLSIMSSRVFYSITNNRIISFWRLSGILFY